MRNTIKAILKICAKNTRPRICFLEKVILVTSAVSVLTMKISGIKILHKTKIQEKRELCDLMEIFY